MRKIKFLLIFASAFAMIPAFAQFAWIDEKGNKHFSDKPPPAGVPESKILKGFKITKTPTVNNEASKPKSVSERNEDFQKRQKESNEKLEKQTSEQNAQNEKQKNCDKARNFLRALESGVRIGSTNESGEKTYLDDAQRKNELEDIRKVLANCT